MSVYSFTSSNINRTGFCLFCLSNSLVDLSFPSEWMHLNIDINTDKQNAVMEKNMIWNQTS